MGIGGRTGSNESNDMGSSPLILFLRQRADELLRQVEVGQYPNLPAALMPKIAWSHEILGKMQCKRTKTFKLLRRRAVYDLQYTFYQDLLAQFRSDLSIAPEVAIQRTLDKIAQELHLIPLDPE